MSVLSFLSSVALRQVIGEGAESVVRVVADRLTDHSQALPLALQRSSDRAWKTLEIALAGEGFLNWFDSTEERAFRVQIRALLDAMPLPLITGAAEYRNACLVELRRARKDGLLLGAVGPEEMRRTLAAHAAQPGLLEADRAALGDMGSRLKQAGHPNLARLVSHPVQPDQALLVVAVRYFFRREVETNETLARGLQFSLTESLTEDQRRGFRHLEQALAEQGQRIEQSLGAVADGVGRINDKVDELTRLVQQLLQLHQMQQQREVRPGQSRSIRGETEKRRVREVVERYQSLPEADRQQQPELLSSVAMLQVAVGDCEEARENFDLVATMVADDPAALARARHNAYRAALEQRDWPRALAELLEAARLCPEQYQPFPLDKYQPQRILGAGGFGVAFLCQHAATRGRLVIKTLQIDGLDRDVNDVFDEARALDQLDHPGIIRLRDCDFADRARRRGYLVMDYFDGLSLGDYVRQNGLFSPSGFFALARQVAEAMQAAHDRGVLHRDLKPDNLLVRREAGGWKVKLIDFGLAVRQEVSEGTVRSPAGKTPAGDSHDVAGTLEYAAPEQLGQLPGVAVGPAADVYGFARTCYFALLGTPQPDDTERETLDTGWRRLLSQCTARLAERRVANFVTVLARLAEIEKGTPARPTVSPPPPTPVPAPKPLPVVEVELIPEVPRQQKPSAPAGPPRVPPRTLGPGLKPPSASRPALSGLWGEPAPEATPAPPPRRITGVGGAFLGDETKPAEEEPTTPTSEPEPPSPPAKKKGLLGDAFS